jgi:hypothetical protein
MRNIVPRSQFNKTPIAVETSLHNVKEMTKYFQEVSRRFQPTGATYKDDEISKEYEILDALKPTLHGDNEHDARTKETLTKKQTNHPPVEFSGAYPRTPCLFRRSPTRHQFYLTWKNLVCALPGCCGRRRYSSFASERR